MFDGSDRDRTDGHWSTVCNQDDRVKDGERRWHAIGETHDRFFTLVSFTIRGEPMAGWGDGNALGSLQENSQHLRARETLYFWVAG